MEKIVFYCITLVNIISFKTTLHLIYIIHILPIMYFNRILYILSSLQAFI